MDLLRVRFDGTTSDWAALFLFLCAFCYYVFTKYGKPYHFTQDEKNLLGELLDNAFDEAEIFEDSELKEDIYLLKQKIKR